MNLLFVAAFAVFAIGGCSSFALTPVNAKFIVGSVGKNAASHLPKDSSIASASGRFKGNIQAFDHEDKTLVQNSHVFSTLFDRYNNMLDKFPLPTKIVSSGVLGAISDVIIQSLSHKSLDKAFELDYRRLLVFTTVCGLYFAPVVDGWFTLLSKIPLPAQLSGTSKAVAMVVLDQTLGALIVTSGFFFAFELAHRLINPSPLPYALTVFEAGKLAVQRNLLPTIQASWYCWPLVNFLNFRFIPPQYRLLVTNIVSIVWNMYLTCVVNN